jgi:Uma2 family endonuclease
MMKLMATTTPMSFAEFEQLEWSADGKVATYLANGVSEVWLVYPRQPHAVVFDRPGIRNEAHSIHTDLLPGVEIPLGQIL